MKVPLRDGIFWWWNLWNVLGEMFSLVEESVEFGRSESRKGK